ncbi:Glutamine transport ATP-binding protein GlnQ [Caloramator mitchellensis]|uniref:Glutamine transport ATP-binding protein GlnQ n=1 Tax=Caloramator mitchellensis TaxID=908809 RepID=A0A0R3JRR7_CALMK|nr:phosphonate ABC transporter ATP-binding protein [Caloramator mitchellensis]KRQ86195.1 Glutamine transport ATP-binding protein GlnQ [Caloramator mitchellensis]
MKKIVELKDIQKRFKEMEVLSSISFSVEEGEIVAILGPSGAGKTTLLNIISGFTHPDNGSVTIDGINIVNYKSNKQLAKKIGIIRQQFDLIDDLKVIHNVLAGKLHEWGFIKSLFSLFFPQGKDEALDALNKVGITEKFDEKTANLSGGEKQRVAIARILLQHPKVVLADEPVSSLDPARAEDILSILVNLARKEKISLIASIHSIEFAKKYFDRLIGIKDGNVVFDLPSNEITDEIIKDLYNYQELK